MFGTQTRLNKPHFSNGIPQKTLKLNGVILDTVKFLLPRQNKENYIIGRHCQTTHNKIPRHVYLSHSDFVCSLLAQV